MSYIKRQLEARSKARSRGSYERMNAYLEGWRDMMMTIWREKIDKYQLIDTGALRRSLQGTLRMGEDGISAEITHRFAIYGLYADLGVGRGFEHDNQGDLQIMNLQYREEHHMDRRRKQRSGKVTPGGRRERKKWFSPKHYASVMKLKDDMARLIGEDFMGQVAQIFDSQGNRRRT